MRPHRLATVLLALIGLTVSCTAGNSQQSTGPSAPTPPSAYDLVLRQVHPDGSVDKSTALAAFALAVAPVPDVPTPGGPQRMIPSGSAAVAWVLAHWAELAPVQQQAVRQALTGGVAPAAYVQPLPGRAPQAPPPDPGLSCATTDSPDAGPYRSVLNTAVGEIAAHLGRPLGLPIALEVNTKQLENLPTGKPSVMYTWSCRATKTAGTQKPTGCTIHINPSAFDGTFSDHDRKSFLTHEAMHCFLYDKFGPAYDDVPAWLAEGIPIWVQTALNGADPIATARWNDYLQLDKTPLFKRTYDALGYYAQLAGSGVDMWGRIDPMTAAFLSGGNAAAWQAAGASDGFVNSWGPGYARGRHPGKDWDITGFGVPGTKPAAVHFDVIDSTSAEAAAPVVGVDLVELNLQADVISFAGSPGTRGIFGAADGSDHPVAELLGGDRCTRTGGCTCPQGSAAEGAQLQPLAKGTGYLGISGGLGAGKATVTGSSLDEFCKKPRQSCLVGTWSSAGFDIQAASGAITEQGGSGVVMRIGADGSASVDFTPMQSITFHAKDTTGSLRYDGQTTGKMTLPPANVTTGTFGDAHGDFSSIVVTVGITSPIQFTVFDHKPLTDLVALAQGLANGLGGGVDTHPLLGAGGFTCSKTTLTVTPPSGAQVNGTWTLNRTGA